MEQIMICGRQKFMGGEIPIVAGGFGAGKKCVSDKTIAEIHDTAEREIRRRITENIRRFNHAVSKKSPTYRSGGGMNADSATYFDF